MDDGPLRGFVHISLGSPDTEARLAATRGDVSPAACVRLEEELGQMAYAALVDAAEMLMAELGRDVEVTDEEGKAILVRRGVEAERLLRERLAVKYGCEVFDTDQLTELYDVDSFRRVFVTVVRKADGQEGSFAFTQRPRLYFDYRPEQG